MPISMKNPGVFEIEINPHLDQDQIKFDQALEALRSIADQEYRFAALKGLIAARIKGEMFHSVPNTPAAVALLNNRMKELENQAVQIGVIDWPQRAPHDRT